MTEKNFILTLIKNTLLVKMPSKLTIIEAITLNEEYHKWVDMNKIEKIILDFGKTEFIDSSGIGSLVNMIKFTKEQQKILEIWSITPQVAKLFSLIDMKKTLPIISNTEPTMPISTSELGNLLSATHPSVRSKTKRLMDIIGGLIGLGVLVILFIPLALAVKLDSSGSILCSQTHCGWMGKRFKIWKFRSIPVNKETINLNLENEVHREFLKKENATHITPVSRFLRQNNLDELPKFWNVVKGDMSLIGINPPTAIEVDGYDIPHWQRLDVRPGLSGEWLVNGDTKIDDFEDLIKLDLRYQENWSLMYDVKLIIKTIKLMLGHSLIL